MKFLLRLISIVLFSTLSACNLVGSQTEPGRVQLAEFTESYVHVAIEFSSTGDQQGILIAIFTPTEPEAHLYSMQLPKDGIDGLGRPTLVELPEGSAIQATGDLQESVASTTEAVSSDLPALPVYPSGEVTLTLPVKLPDLSGKPIEGQVMITFMACTPQGCHKPVMDRLVDVTIPAN